MQDARGVRIQHRVRGHLLAGRHADDAALAVRVLHATHESNDLLLRRRAGLLARWRRLVGSRRSLIRLHRIRIHRRAQRTGGVEMRRIYLYPALRRAAAGECRAAYVRDLLDTVARRQPVSDLADLPLGVAVHQQVRLGVEQDRATHSLRPVVEVRNAPERRFDAADDDRNVLERLARSLGVDDYGAVGSGAANTARRVGIVTAQPAVRGV